MFKIGSSPTDSTTTTVTTPHSKMKKPEQEPLTARNNLKQTFVFITHLHSSLSSLFSTKKGYVENAVKTAFEQQAPHPSQHNSSTSKGNTDFLDRQIFEKADLDYIPGLDYDVGPVFMPSKWKIFPWEREVHGCVVCLSSIIR